MKLSRKQIESEIETVLTKMYVKGELGEIHNWAWDNIQIRMTRLFIKLMKHNIPSSKGGQSQNVKR